MPVHNMCRFAIPTGYERSKVELLIGNQPGATYINGCIYSPTLPKYFSVRPMARCFARGRQGRILATETNFTYQMKFNWETNEP